MAQISPTPAPLAPGYEDHGTATNLVNTLEAPIATARFAVVRLEGENGHQRIIGKLLCNEYGDFIYATQDGRIGHVDENGVVQPQDAYLVVIDRNGLRVDSTTLQNLVNYDNPVTGVFPAGSVEDRNQGGFPRYLGRAGEVVPGVTTVWGSFDFAVPSLDRIHKPIGYNERGDGVRLYNPGGETLPEGYIPEQVNLYLAGQGYFAGPEVSAVDVGAMGWVGELVQAHNAVNYDAPYVEGNTVYYHYRAEPVNMDQPSIAIPYAALPIQGGLPKIDASSHEKALSAAKELLENNLAASAPEERNHLPERRDGSKTLTL